MVGSLPSPGHGLLHFSYPLLILILWLIELGFKVCLLLIFRKIMIMILKDWLYACIYDFALEYRLLYKFTVKDVLRCVVVLEGKTVRGSD